MDIAVVGAGTMGAGIAESAALAGMSVTMIDVREEALERGMQTIGQDLARRVKKGRISEDESRDVIGSVHTTTSVEGCSGAPLVVEAVIEDAEVKKQVFAELEGVVGEEAVLATNTSSLSVAGIAAATGSPERVVDALLQPGAGNAPGRVSRWSVHEPSSPEPGRGGCRKPRQDAGPSLRHARVIVNRVARPFYLEALRIVESGADPGKVDAQIREAGFRMGPLELADLIGHDINLSVSESLFERYYYQPRLRPSYLQGRWSKPESRQEERPRFLRLHRER